MKNICFKNNAICYIALFLLTASAVVYGDNSPSKSDASAPIKQELNSPLSGSVRYSNGNFGEPKLTGKKGERYHTKQELTKSAQSTPVTGSFSYSSRDNAKTKLSGTKGGKYYKTEDLQNGQNQADIGSKAGSNQLFQYPEDKSH